MAANRAFTHRCCVEELIPPNRFSHAPLRTIILLTMSAPEKLTVALMNVCSTLGSRVTHDYKMFVWPQDSFRISVEDGVSTIIEKLV